MKPFESWDAVPNAGKAQILAAIAFAEIWSEYEGTHYMKGGNFPQFPEIDFSGVDEDKMVEQRSKELNNGRLAMIAMMSFVAAATIPGSVPTLVDNAAF
jgi:hypothetical protein